MLTIVIQAGGESRRMGQDKALKPFLGRPLIERVVERVSPLAQEVLVTANRPQDYAFLGLRCEPDRLPGRGALGGLYTALAIATQPLVGVVACDMPFVSPALLQAELDLLRLTGAQAVIPRHEQGTEPFHAMYDREACLPAVEAALQAGRWRVDAWFPAAEIRFLTPEEIAPHDPQGLAFWNVNTPEEFARAEALASGSAEPK